MCSNPLYKRISEELNFGELISKEIIQSLWSGYGELVRLKFELKNVIVKHMKLPKPELHPRGSNTDFSHQRKLHSYEVEVNWYENFSKEVDERCRIPQGLKTFKTENEYLIVMEDLSDIGLVDTTLDANESHIKICLSWLANFHAKYLNVRNELLWETGTYWHLETRPDEFERLEDGELKEYSGIIDQILKNTKYQTIVHGDAKLANFCFNKIVTKCAAVDFQYVGHGCGMKDLVYFMSSAVEPEDCEDLEEFIKDIYFDELHKAIEIYHPSIDPQDIENEWRILFCLSWADFKRFLKGWSPEHFKINTYSQEVTNRALIYLKRLENA